MKVLAINGSPRKKWNTSKLLEKALEGARSQGAETELIHLYDLTYQGCNSCFSCKLKGGKSYGTCSVKDDLTPLFKKIENINAIILGSPIYLGTATGEMRSFMERLIFPYLVYDTERSTLFPKRLPVGFIYTMNVPEKYIQPIGYTNYFKITESLVERVLGESESLYVTDTYQFNDYSKYVATCFNSEEKLKRHNEIFPLDCEKAFEMGVNLTKNKEI